MNIQDTLEYLAKNRPEVIHISGKTSTGKSTFAKELENLLGYEIVELDQILINEVVKRHRSVGEDVIFTEVYKYRRHLDWIEQFVSATKKKLNELHTFKVIDGAIAHPQTLKEVLDGSNAIIVYLHPENLEVYAGNLTSRFLTATAQDNAGLPSKFWDKVPHDDFISFLKDRQLSQSIKNAIKMYAKESQIESTKRLNVLQENFDNILVTTI